MDADDVFQGIELLRGTIEKNPDVDAFVTHYMYQFDEHGLPIVVHSKSQVVRNDGCVEWEGPLHEDFKENRAVSVYFIKGIERIHLSDEERGEDSKIRNLEIALEQLQNLPNDPRSYWNVGNAYKAAGKNEEALAALEKFLELSQSDDEKYIVRLRRAESFWALNKRSQAMDEARYAIGLKPMFPDAYHLAGSLLYEQGLYLQASEMYFAGLTKQPPYYSILVFNPRDYDYVPMMNLAKCYFNLSRPDLALPLLEGCLKIYPNDESLQNITTQIKEEVKSFNDVTELVYKLQKIEDLEELKKELEKIPKKYEAHPGICNLRNTKFVKTESSGKDIAFFCGFTEEEWTPETARTKGIGGSEEAAIWITKLLSQRGYNVTVYNNCGHEVQSFDGVTYKPFWMYNYRDKQDITVFWRAMKPLDWDVNSEKIFVDLHDVIPAGEMTEKRLAKVDKIFVKSKFHRSLFPGVPDDKFVVIPNGIDAELFAEVLPRDNKLIINTSSADRSLSAALDIYEQIKKEVPDAKMKWAYGWGVFDTVHANSPEMMSWKQKQIDRMKELGVEELGRVNHNDVANLYKTANIFLYPSEFGEIDCISLTKALAGRCAVYTTDFAAMGEKPGNKVHSRKTKDTWALPGQYDFALDDESSKLELARHVIDELKNPRPVNHRQEITDKYDWNKIIDLWINNLHPQDLTQ
jgi:tetratricopeptide (TPR) repeat protein